MATMPFLNGLILQEAEFALEGSGVLVLANLGYFQPWPIQVEWVKAPDPATYNWGATYPDSFSDPITLGGAPAFRLLPGVVIGQFPNSGDSVPVNPNIFLRVIQFPMAVSYQGNMR